jgi:phosphatidylglycerophosphate synthase
VERPLESLNWWWDFVNQVRPLPDRFHMDNKELTIYQIIPYALSLSRIPMALLMILFSSQLELRRYVATAGMYLLAMATDGLDGFLARRWGTYSQLGYVLDSLGDRAIHLALMLVFLGRYSFHPVFIWLIIFRDFSITGVQLASKDWPAKTRHLRPIFLTNATTLRIWLGLFLLRDGFCVFTGADLLNTPWFHATQMTILIVTILVAYYGLVRSFGWLGNRDFDAN